MSTPIIPDENGVAEVGPFSAYHPQEGGTLVLSSARVSAVNGTLLAIGPQPWLVPSQTSEPWNAGSVLHVTLYLDVPEAIADIGSGTYTIEVIARDPASGSLYFCTFPVTNGEPPEGDVNASPSSLSFGLKEIEDPVVKHELNVTVINPSTVPVNLSGASITGDSQFTLETDPTPRMLLPSGVATFRVGYTPDVEGSHSGTLEVTHDGPDSPLEISLSGSSVQPEPNISVSPPSIDFGRAMVGSTPQKTLTIANVGTQPLTVSNVTFGGANAGLFSASGMPALPFVVSAESQVQFNVRYEPAATGTHAGTLTIASDDPDEPSVVVALTGESTNIFIHDTFTDTDNTPLTSHTPDEGAWDTAWNELEIVGNALVNNGASGLECLADATAPYEIEVELDPADTSFPEVWVRYTKNIYPASWYAVKLQGGNLEIYTASQSGSSNLMDSAPCAPAAPFTLYVRYDGSTVEAEADSVVVSISANPDAGGSQAGMQLSVVNDRVMSFLCHRP